MARIQRSMPAPAQPAGEPAPRRRQTEPYDQAREPDRDAAFTDDLTADLPHRRPPRPQPAEEKPSTARRRAARQKPEPSVQQAHHQESRRQERPDRELHADGYDTQDAPAHPLRDRGHARRRRARRRRAVVISTLLVLAVAIWVLFVFVFKISTVTVGGTSLYNETVILEKFGYRVGDNLFSFSARQAEERIGTALPYLETVRVTRMPPGSVHIEVTPSVETYCFVTDNARVITSPSLKVLRVGDNTGGLLEISGIELGASVPGQPLQPVQQDRLEAANQILAALECDLLDNVTRVDVSDIYGITVRCEGRFLIRLGTTVELDYKLQLAAKTIYGSLAQDATGVVDVSSAATSHAAYYTPQQPDTFD